MLEEIKGLLEGLRLRGMNASIESILVEAEQQGGHQRCIIRIIEIRIWR